MKTIATAPVMRATHLASATDYLALTKPRVVAMILLTTATGFLLASRAPLVRLEWGLLALTLAGTALVAGGTLALNQYLERETDALMKRTRRRPIPDGRMRPVEALAFGVSLTGAGLLCLTFQVDPVCGLVTAATTILYLFAYTPLKRRSALCTVVGAFPGALPPVAGWAAAGGALGIEAAVLFGILFFWQLPHSLAIAQLYREDYDRAGVRLLPTVDRHGGSTGRQTLFNCLALLAVGLLPALVGVAGLIYFMTALACGLALVVLGGALALRPGPVPARRLLYATYAYVPIVLIVMSADRVIR